MQVTVFQSEFEMIESTSAIAGKFAASLTGEGEVWSDAFIYDPKSKIVNFDKGQLYSFVHGAKKKASPAAMIFLTITDVAIRGINGVKGLFGGSYGGTMGTGQAGSMIVMASALLFIVVAIMAAIVVVPLSILGWLVRKKIDGEIAKESAKFIDQILVNFDEMAVGRMNVLTTV